MPRNLADTRKPGASHPRLDRGIARALSAGLGCFVPCAVASYAQMTLPGLEADILFALIAAWLLLIDVVLLCRGFRSKASVIVSTVISLALVVGLWRARESVDASFQLIGAEWKVRLLATSMVVVPLVMLLAPIAQHVELRAHRPRRAVYVAVAVTIGLAGTGFGFSYLDDHPLPSTRAEWQEWRDRGEAVAPGELAALRDAFEADDEWGSMESLQLLHGIQDSALIHGGTPLLPHDRTALVEMLERDRVAARPALAAAHYYGFIETKLLWDTLEPGSVDRSIPPGTALPEEYLLPFIDRHGSQRLCSADGLADTDRTALMRALAGYRGPEVEARVSASLDRLDEACRTPRR